MQTLRRLRKLIALVALIWLPMTVFAQVCATQMVIAAMGGLDHPGLVQPGDLVQHAGHAADSMHATNAPVVTIVVDAETFWRSVDTFDDACDMKSMCAFAGFAVVASTSPAAIVFPHSEMQYTSAVSMFATRSLTPDTPPPRLTL